MKKLLCLILAIFFLMSLLACTPEEPIDEITTTTKTHLTNPDTPPYNRGYIPWDVKQIAYHFDTYDEIVRAIVEDSEGEYNFIHREKEYYNEYFGDGYTALLNDWVQKKSIPVPMVNRAPIPLTQDYVGLRIALSPIGDGDLSQMSYCLSMRDPSVRDITLSIQFSSYSSVSEVANADDVWALRRGYNYGYTVVGEYENCYVSAKALQLADRTVQAHIMIPKEDNPRTYISFLYDGMLVSAWSDFSDILTDDFWATFSIGEYVYSDEGKPSEDVVTYTRQQYMDYVAEHEMPQGFVPYEKLAFLGELLEWNVPENMQDTLGAYWYSLDVDGEMIDVYVNMPMPSVRETFSPLCSGFFYEDVFMPYDVIQLECDNVRGLYMDGCLKYLTFEIDGVLFSIHLKNHTFETPYEPDSSSLMGYFAEAAWEWGYTRFAREFRGELLE